MLMVVRSIHLMVHMLLEQLQQLVQMNMVLKGLHQKWIFICTEYLVHMEVDRLLVLLKQLKQQ